MEGIKLKITYGDIAKIIIHVTEPFEELDYKYSTIEELLEWLNERENNTLKLNKEEK